MSFYWFDSKSNTVQCGDALPDGCVSVGAPPSPLSIFDSSAGTWKLPPDYYRQERVERYPIVGDQLDAILKYLQTKTDLTPDITNIIAIWSQVKKDYPKPQ